MPEIIAAAAEFLASLRSANRTAAQDVVRRSVAFGSTADDILDGIVIPGLVQLGKGWEAGTISLTQVYMGGRIAEGIVDELLPAAEASRNAWGKVLIGTLEDRHGMGQRIVASYLRISGASVLSLGIGVSPAAFVNAAKEQSVDIIAISTLMYRSALLVRQVREMLDCARMDIPLLVGGAPFNMDRDLWRLVGASAMGGNPAEGITEAKRLIVERRVA